MPAAEYEGRRWIPALNVSVRDTRERALAARALVNSSNQVIYDADDPPPSGSGDVVGPGSATDGHLAIFDGTTGKLIKDGGAPGGGGSSIDATTAFVRPAPIGNDGTASVGGTPFLTVQGAINAFAVLVGGTSPPDQAVIDIGINRFTESLMLDNSSGLWPILTFKGINNNNDTNDQSEAFTNLTITGGGSFNQSDIRLKDCGCGGTITTDSPLVLLLDCANMNSGSVVSTYNSSGGGTSLTIGSIYGTGTEVGNITADDTGILVYGVTPSTSGATISSANGVSVIIGNCGHAPTGGAPTTSLFSINAPNAAVNVNDSLIKDATVNNLILVRSKAYGAVSLTSSPNSPLYTDDQGPYAYNYDFAIEGGAQGTIYLGGNNGSNGGALPSGFVVTGAILEVITPLDSASHLATVALSSGETDGDLQAATLVSGAPWSTTGLKSLAALFKTTGGGFTSDNPVIVAAIEDLTAGKFTLHIEGYLS